LKIREAPFALRVVQRSTGRAAIVYRRQGDAQWRDRLHRIAALSPLAFTAGALLLRDAVVHSASANGDSRNGRGRNDPLRVLTTGAFHPLSADWGARVACFALVSTGLRDGERLLRAASHFRAAAGTEAAWWLGLVKADDSGRALRALRILTEAVE
jgi:hypothetical protein